MNAHPTPAELESLILSRVSPEHARSIILHLLRGCERCRIVLAGLGQELLILKPKDTVELSPEDHAAYDAAIDRAFRSAMQQMHSAGRKETPEEAAREEALQLITERGLEAISEAPSHLQGITLIEAVLDRSWALRYQDPLQMVELAEAASRLAEGLNSERYGADRVANLQFKALTELGNAYRVADDLDRAKDTLDEATKFTLEGNIGERLSARYFDVLGSLYGALRLFEMANSAFLIAHLSYQRLRDEHFSGRSLIKLGIYTGYNGKPEEALRLIQQGLRSIEEEREPDLVFLALHNQARLLVDSGRHKDARFALWELKKRGLDPGGRVNELKVHWLEGQIFAAMEEFEHAERALSEVKAGFAEADLPYKSALAGLELGAVRLRQGRLDESEKVVLEAVDVFIALNIRREVMAAVLMLKKAFETRVATAALIEGVADFLRRAEENPDLCFEPLQLR